MHGTGRRNMENTVTINTRMTIILSYASAFMKLIRWQNILMIIVIQYAVYYALVDRIYKIAETDFALGYGYLSLLVIITVMIAAAGYIINDIMDFDTDMINKPAKQIVGKAIAERSALIVYRVFNLIAGVIGFYLAWKVGSWRLGFLFPMIMILLWLYSAKYKSTILWGNIAVAFISAMVVLLVWLFEFFMLRQDINAFVAITPYLGMITLYFAFFAVFAFLLTLLREIIKDAEDVEGDTASAINTLAVKYGIAASRKVATIVSFISLVIVMSASVIFLKNSLTIAGIYYIVAVLIPIVYLIIKIRRAEVKSDFRLLSKLIKILMLAGLIGLQPILMSIA